MFTDLRKRNQSNNRDDMPAITDEPFISGGTVFKFLFYTFMMVTFPISSYFLSKKYVYENYMGWSHDDSIVPSALTAVAMVHVILFLFVYSAYTEDIPRKPKRE